MGHATNVYGIISYPSKSPSNDFIWKKNIETLCALPDVDDSYPSLSNKMFSKEFQPGWDERHIHFAANYKNLEFQLQSWIEKFEDLLSKLMWLSVTVKIETELSGNFEISWQINNDSLNQWQNQTWIPTTEWQTTGIQKKN